MCGIPTFTDVNPFFYGNTVDVLKIVDVVLFLYLVFDYDEGLNLGVS